MLTEVESVLEKDCEPAPDEGGNENTGIDFTPLAFGEVKVEMDDLDFDEGDRFVFKYFPFYNLVCVLKVKEPFQNHFIYFIVLKFFYANTSI